MTPESPTAGVRRFAIPVLILAVVALAAIAGWQARGEHEPGAAIDPLAVGGSPSFEPPRLPETIQGLTVRTISEVVEARDGGTLGRGPVAVGGYWSDGSVAHSCAPPDEQTGDLEIYCHDGEWGITELFEPIMIIDRNGFATTAVGPTLTPWFPNELPGLQALFSLPIINGQRFLPVPIVVVGHFNDPRADDCRAAARQLCRDRLVVDSIAMFNPDAVPRPPVTPPPTAFPAEGLPALFGPESCAGNVAYSFVGWTTTEALKLPFSREGHVWAMVTAEPVDLGGQGAGWNDDPNGSGHRFRPMGRQICIGQKGQEGVVEFGSVPGSEFTLWDDGLRTEGLELIR